MAGHLYRAYVKFWGRPGEVHRGDKVSLILPNQRIVSGEIMSAPSLFGDVGQDRRRRARLGPVLRVGRR